MSRRAALRVVSAIGVAAIGVAALGIEAIGGLAIGAAVIAVASCDDPAPATRAPTTSSFRFDLPDFYASPFPFDGRTRADGTVDLSNFPRPEVPNLVTSVVDLIDGHARGFGTTSTIYFTFSAPLAEPALTFEGSLAPGSPVALVGPDGPVPISVKVIDDGGPYGDLNMLALLPLQGAPLRPNTLYVAYATGDLRDKAGERVEASAELAAYLAGTRPKGMNDAADASLRAALEVYAAHVPKNVVALTAFTTGDPTAEFDAVVKAATASPLPAPKSAFVPAEVFDDYCVYHTTIDMPEYQNGTPPYAGEGGEWQFDAAGAPIVDRLEESNFVVTIPRAPMPAAGYPIVVLSRTGAGGDRPLVDRGPHATAHGPSIAPGTGPALTFAQAGFAGSSIDGPQGGLRNPLQDDEQLLIFNVGNPAALRDNIRQSALELILQAHILGGVTVDVSACPGATAPGNVAKFDKDTIAIMGHSMGATISPLALSSEPLFKAGILSGGGGSFIANVMYKLEPLEVRGFAELLVGYAGTPYSLSEWDPALAFFQWALEGADPPAFDPRIARPASGGPKHVLMMQGIVDHYILPPIANAMSLSMGLDLAGEALDAKTPEIATMSPIEGVLGLGLGKKIPFPASLNVTAPGGAKVTAVLTQHAEDGIEDGHEVVFQTEAPKHEYRCFLEGLKTGAPIVPGPGAALDPCE